MPFLPSSLDRYSLVCLCVFFFIIFVILNFDISFVICVLVRCVSHSLREIYLEKEFVSFSLAISLRAASLYTVNN